MHTSERYRKLVRGNMMRRAQPTLAILGVLLGAATGCRGVASAFGPSPALARAHGEALFGAVADRFTNVRRTPKFEAARMRLGRFALSPSKVWSDTGIWTSSGVDSSRTLVVSAGMQGERYVFHARADAAPPQRAGDSRHVIRLRMRGEGEYEWLTSVEHAIGEAKAPEIAGALTALLASAEGRTERETREDYREAFPRARAALGRLLTLDTLRAQRLADGSTIVSLSASMHPERLRPTMPALAAYVVKYLEPARYHAVLADRQGGHWLEADAREQVLTLRVRTRDGTLLPLEGPARAMPEHLQLRGEAFAKVMIFTVGVTDLVADFSFVRGAHDRGWLLRFDREPTWHLPLAVRHLIRAPLRRPFEGGGTVLRIAVHDSAGAQTHLTRHLTTTVKESAILRWMGSLGFTAMSDYTGPTEVEENRFIAEAFDGLRLDLRALLTGAPGPFERAGP
ncbi:MAG: hypothetical protein ACJ8AO_22305 [Gemmatimonadaceae bacterium]